jgi:hypothetical protein
LLTVDKTHVLLTGSATRSRQITLDYLQSVALPSVENESAKREEATLHITSSPSGGEIYIDGKFFGGVPAITLENNPSTKKNVRNPALQALIDSPPYR